MGGWEEAWNHAPSPTSAPSPLAPPLRPRPLAPPFWPRPLCSPSRPHPPAAPPPLAPLQLPAEDGLPPAAAHQRHLAARAAGGEQRRARLPLPLCHLQLLTGGQLWYSPGRASAWTSPGDVMGHLCCFLSDVVKPRLARRVPGEFLAPAFKLCLHSGDKWGRPWLGSQCRRSVLGVTVRPHHTQSRHQKETCCPKHSSAKSLPGAPWLGPPVLSNTILCSASAGVHTPSTGQHKSHSCPQRGRSVGHLQFTLRISQEVD